MMLGIMAISMFLIGCAPEKVDVTDDSGNVVGEAFRVAGRYQIKAPAATCGKTNALRLGQTETFQHPNNNVYEIYLKSISNGKAIFTINGQQTTALAKTQNFNLADGEEFIVQEVASDGALFCVNGGSGTTITPFCGDTNTAKLGQPTTYHFPNGQDYEIELKIINNQRVNFEINGQQANSLERKTSFTLANGEEFIVQEVASDGALFCINGGHGTII